MSTLTYLAWITLLFVIALTGFVGLIHILIDAYTTLGLL